MKNRMRMKKYIVFPNFALKIKHIINIFWIFQNFFWNALLTVIVVGLRGQLLGAQLVGLDNLL